MDIALWIVLASLIIGALAYNRASLIIHSSAVFLLLVAVMAIYDIGAGLFIITMILFFLVALSLNVPALRRTFISAQLFTLFKKNMPSVSSTEKAAIEAGTVWWDGELFSGDPDWNKLLAVPAPEMSEKEQAFLHGPVEELCSMLDDWQITQELQDLPDEVWNFIKEKGFFGMIIPVNYGGLNFSAQAHSAVVMKIASRSLSAAVTVMVPNSLGPAELLLKYGTEEQKNNYLPRLATGEEIPCFALTGPEAGSDASSIPDSGVVCRGEFNGESDVLGIRLNWEKRYITLGPVATVIGLAFRLYDPEHLIGDRDDAGITLALIPTDIPGITIGSRHFPLDSAFQNGPNQGTDVFVPIDWIIGGRNRAGEGWQMLMNCLAEGRSISLPALSTASCKLSTRFTGAYARIRKQFNRPIGEFEGVKEALARIAGFTYLADSARTLTAVGVDQGEEPAVISAIVKYHLTELARKVVNDAMDVSGGAGICMGPRNVLGRGYQSIPIGITVEGANILTRNMIIFGQGVLRGHPYLLREVTAANEKDHEKGLRNFDNALFGHVGFIISNTVRSFLLALTGSRITNVPGAHGSQRYFQSLTRMSSAFALISDITLLVLGGSLKRKERISARLADILSHLFIATAALKRFEDEGAKDSDQPLLDWSCQYALFMIQESMYNLFENFPNRIVGALLKLLVFPYGGFFKMPPDTLDHAVADIIMAPSEVRDRITEGIFTPDDESEPLGRLERALPGAIAAEPLEKIIRKAVKSGAIKKGGKERELAEALKCGIINEEEAEIIRSAIAARKEVIRVDDFPKDRWRRG